MTMANKTKRAVSPKIETQTLRASVSFPRDLYDTLERIARDRKVSLAWVVRDAAEKYVGDQWPLFDDRGKGA
jgi:metal-responsive CopG/Arc/MetJ family transcriptional regulator